MAVITVMGSGRIQAAPDEIVLSLSVEGREKEYEKALETAEEKHEKVSQAVKDCAFPEDTLKTVNYNVRTEYEGVRDPDGNYRNVLSAYVCRYDLRLRFPMNIEKLREVLSRLAASAAQAELHIRFGLSDPEKFQSELLRETAKNAREKAEVLAEASGLHLGALVSIKYHAMDRVLYSETAYEEALSMDTAGAPRMAKISNAAFTPEDIDANDEAEFTWELV